MKADKSINLIAEKLQSNNKDEVLFTIKQLRNTGNPKILPFVIDLLSYSKPADSELVFGVLEDKTEADFTVGTGVALEETYILTDGSPVEYVIAMEDSKLYKAYSNGFIKNGDIMTDGSLDYYIQVEDELFITVGSTDYLVLLLSFFGRLEPVNVNI